MPDQPLGNGDELSLKNSFIFDACHAFEELHIDYEESFTHEYLLNRIGDRIYMITFIIPSNTLVNSLIEINKMKSIRIIDDKMNGSCKNHQYSTISEHNSTEISCYKKSFGNWKIIITGTRHEIIEAGSIVLLCQLKSLDYVTIEVLKEVYYQLCELDVLNEKDITLIPTGYVGYLVNINLYQENLTPLLNELINIYNTNLQESSNNNHKHQNRSINKQHILNSLNDLQLGKQHNQRESVCARKDAGIIGNIEPSENIEKHIRLTKAEIGFLIGKEGSRINAIRNQTGCKITISPLPVSESHLWANKKIYQSVKLFGTVDKVENAYTMINVNLAIYRENKSDFL